MFSEIQILSFFFHSRKVIQIHRIDALLHVLIKIELHHFWLENVTILIRDG